MILRIAANAIGITRVSVSAVIAILCLVVAIPGLIIMEETGLLIRIARKFDTWLDIRQELLEDDD